MRRHLPTLLVALLLLGPLLATLPAGSGQGTQLQAGAAKAEITPPVTTPLFAYTARHALLATGEDLEEQRTPRFLDQRDDGVDTELYAKTFLESQGVHTRLYANAYVLDDGQDTVAIVLTDLGALPGEVHQAVAERLADQDVPIPRENLMIGSTHTHGGPGGFFQYQGYALLGGDAFDPRIFTRIVEQTTDAIVQAYQAKEPATLAIGTAELPGASRQRSAAAHVPGHSHDADHVDEEATVMRLDTLDGRPLGAITLFAAHGTIVGADDLLITGDNQGVASRLLARSIAKASGQDEHDVVVAYLNSAQGDVSPVGSGQTFFEQVEEAGRRQAPALFQAWQALGGQGTSQVDLDTRFTFVCFCGQEVQDGERISTVPILGSGGPDPFPQAGIPGHDPKVPLLIGPGAVPQAVRIQAMRLDGHVLVTMPGEASVTLGERIEQEIEALSTPEHPVTGVDVVGLANDYISYMSTLSEYEVQEYEGTFNLYGRMTGPLFQQALVSLAGDLLTGTPVPPGYQGVVEHPSTTTPPVDDLELVPGRQPVQELEVPGPHVAPGEVARYGWLGGSPAVDHPLDVPMVTVVEAGTGKPLLDDRGFELQLRYEKVGPDEHHWSVAWPVEDQTPVGDYRFEVEGRWVSSPGTVEAYSYTSRVFEVG